MRSLGRTFALGAVVLMLAACQWGHVGFSPARTRFNPFENTIGAENVDQLVERWSVPLAAPVGDPIVSGGRVFVNAGAGERTAFHALDATSGAPRWSVEDERPNPDLTFVERLPGAVVGDLVYTGFNVLSLTSLLDPTGRVDAYDAASGDLVWSSGAEAFPGPIKSPPAVVDGTVYARFVFACCRGTFVTGGFATWDAATGEQGFLGGFEPGSSVAVTGGLVYQAGSSQLGAFDGEGFRNCRDADPPGARICDPVWSGAIGSNATPDSSPAVANGLVYVGSDDNKLYAFDADGCGAATCPPLWTATTGGDIDSSPAVANGVVYVGSDDNTLYAFDADGCGAATCPPLWSATPAAGDIDSSPAVANGVVYVGSDDDNLYAFDADGCGAATCTPLRTLTTGGDVNSSPALGNKMVYVGSGDGRLYAFGLAS